MNIKDYQLEKDFDKKFTKFLTEDLEKGEDIVEELISKGLVASYTDDKGRSIRHYPNGKKFLLEYIESSYTFIEKEEIID